MDPEHTPVEAMAEALRLPPGSQAFEHALTHEEWMVMFEYHRDAGDWGKCLAAAPVVLKRVALYSKAD